MKKIFFSLISLSLLFFSCKKEEKYPGYTEHEQDIYYKLLAFDEGDKKPVEENYIELHLILKTMNDSVLADSEKQNHSGSVIIPYKKDSLGKYLSNMFSILSEGDSVSFIAQSEEVFPKLFQISKPDEISENVKLEVKLKKVLNKTEYAERLVELNKMSEDLDIEEHRALLEYLKKESIETNPIGAGIYYIPITEGEGPPVEPDKIADIHYKGYFLNGEVFDSTKAGEPFEYFVGTEDQIIKGLEDGLSLMKEGGKAKFILPSQLAFGDNGSSAGIVPPYTTVIYEVHVLKVN